MRSLHLGCLLVVLFLPLGARADALPPPEPIRCDAGFVVAHDHGGTHCVRPGCDATADCPAPLLCTPRRCLAAIRLPECLDGSSGAKEPPDPCRGIEDRGPCAADASCPEGAWCSRGTCLPADEHAAFVAALPADPTPASGGAADTPGAPEAPERIAPATVPASGGGCCGSRGARASASALLVPLALGVILAHRRR